MAAISLHRISSFQGQFSYFQVFEEDVGATAYFKTFI